MIIRNTWRFGAMMWAVAGLLVMAVGVPAAQAGPTVAPDNSLAMKEYLEAGVPAIEKPWTLDDYKKAGTALEEIAKKDATKLPRFNSKNSGELFADCTAQKNLEFFNEKAVAVDTRAEKAGDIAAYVPIFAVYANATKAEQAFDAEVLELGGFILRAELAAAQVVTEFKAAHQIVEDNAGFKQMRAGFAQTVGGVVEIMMDHTNVRTSESTRFASGLKAYLPKLAAELVPEAQDHLKALLKENAAKEEDKDFKTALIELLAALK